MYYLICIGFGGRIKKKNNYVCASGFPPAQKEKAPIPKRFEGPVYVVGTSMLTPTKNAIRSIFFFLEL